MRHPFHFQIHKATLMLVMMLLLSSMHASAQTGTWSGVIDIRGTRLTLVFNLSDTEKATLDVPDQKVTGIEATVRRDAFGGIRIEIPKIGAEYRGTWLASMIGGVFSQNGHEFELTLKPGVPKLNRPQTPVGPFPYTTEEVTFRNGGYELHGTLSLPEKFGENTPAVVMITGSGVQNRDEEIFGHRPFAVIADFLARAGIATLRYDDRGLNDPKDTASNATYDLMKGDAVAGIQMLRERKFKHVGVLGHSEGGTLAFLLAADHAADFIVSLAGMILPGDEVLVRQNREGVVKAGLGKDVAEEYCRLLSDAFRAVKAGETAPSADLYSIPDGLKQNYLAVLQVLSTPYMKSMISADAGKVLDRITCPVLALNGKKDTQVDCTDNLSILEKGLKCGCTVLALDGLNHLFQHCTTGDVSEYKTIEETFSPEVLKTIADWISLNAR